MPEAYRRISRRKLIGSVTEVPASGVIEFGLGAPVADTVWEVERIVTVRRGAGTGESVTTYVGTVDDDHIEDWTIMPTPDGQGRSVAVADEASPIRVPSQKPLTHLVEGATAGDLVSCAATVRVLTLTPGSAAQSGDYLSVAGV